MGYEKIVKEVLAQAHGDISESALTSGEVLEMEIYTHPFVILALGFLLKVGNKILLLLCLVEKTELFIYQTLVSDATDIEGEQ